MRYTLRQVTTGDDWKSLHAIRRAELFPPGKPGGYDEHHPDDRAEGHIPFVLLRDDRPIGVARLDLRGRVGVVRLVAVTASEQRRGHGRAMEALLASEAARRGVEVMRVNSAPDAVGFYEMTGWRREGWDASELTGNRRDCVQMTKVLVPATPE